MTFLKFIPPILSFLLLAAHYSRVSQYWLVSLCLVMPFLLLVRKKWVMRVLQVLLVLGGYIWIQTIVFLVTIRLGSNRPWIRLVVILGFVALFTIASAVVFETGGIRRRYREDKSAWLPSLSAFLLTGSLLSFIQLKVSRPMLLMERFWPGSGWVEVTLLAFYAGWVTEKILEAGPNKRSKIRSRIWMFFSLVFFSQLVIGLAGVEKFLMTGKLHLPIPALIIAGPLYRGEGFFMPILFLITVLLIGPAWCSFLCYIGAWDNRLARTKDFPQSLTKRKNVIRILVLFLVVITALVLRNIGVAGPIATGLALIFGIFGVGLMIFMSRKNGVMTHCVTYCPIGLAANWLGRLSPFRIRIKDSCTDCLACRLSCRYDALREEDIKKLRPGLTCTLCGDCIGHCKENALQYGFLRLKPHTARFLFYVLIVSFHAVMLGIARI